MVSHTQPFANSQGSKTVIVCIRWRFPEHSIHPRRPTFGDSGGTSSAVDSEHESAPRPNKRLELTGAREGRIAFPRWPAFLSPAHSPCATGHLAGSLRVLRQAA